MKSDALIELERRSRKAHDCFVVTPVDTRPGGVDPLGLRQINFDLMNEVFPGLNNVARHIRPFTLVAWAWRRTIALARERKAKLTLSQHEDFVARIEVAFTWSMLQRYDAASVDLPGKQRIEEQWGDQKAIRFGDEQWMEFVRARRHSTALTAAVNYGPGLRALHFLDEDPDQPGVRVPAPDSEKLLDAFEKRLAPILKHKVFQSWGECSLTRATADKWVEVWGMETILAAERRAMRDRLIGELASKGRRAGFRLLVHVYKAAQKAKKDEGTLRSAMCDLVNNELNDDVALWRRVQVRQSFRLALEALFEWIIAEIGGGTSTTDVLAQRLLDQVGPSDGETAREWFGSLVEKGATAVHAMENLQYCLRARQDVGRAALTALAVSVLSPADLHDGSHSSERLPITLAAADLERLATGTPERFLAYVIESWIIAQHTYWSVGRGIADARVGGNRILRLRLVLEPSGWRVTRGQGSRGTPSPTPDRLRTALSLARESGIVG